MNGEVRVSQVARFVIDDEPVEDLRVGRFDDGGALMFVDARATGVGRRPVALVVLIACAAIAVGAGTLQLAQGENAPQPSATSGAESGSAEVPALVLGGGGGGRMSAATGEAGHARRR